MYLLTNIRRAVKWIVFEGPDCTGKSTIILELSKILERSGYRVLVTAEPSRSPIGRLIRDWLLREKVDPPHIYALTFTADRYYHYYNIVKRGLEQGLIVLQERYKLSTIVYQSEMGIDEKWIMELNRYVPDPDLTIVLDADPEIIRERLHRKSSREIFERDIETLSRIRQKYLDIATRLGLPVVRTDRDVRDVVWEVYTIVRRVLES
ncbi:MAG: dTMP kinase [Crenarchaeota archaeon]|nr:dTMP kinase [Thermoproteota archaeon]